MHIQSPVRVIFILLIVACVSSCSQAPDPKTVLNSWNDALNQGQIDVALSYLAENAVVTIVPPPSGSGIFTGKSEIRAWYEGNTAQHSYNEMIEVKVDGEKVTWTSKFIIDEWKKLGIEPLVYYGEGTIKGGKIQSYTATLPPESLAKLPPPP